MTFKEWLEELAWEFLSYGFTPFHVREVLRWPECWYSFWDEGYTPRQAFYEDLQSGY